MKTRYFFLLAAMGLLASCSKELDEIEAPVSQDGVKTVISVGFADTKTYMGDKDGENHHKLFWSKGDQIAVNGVTSEALGEMTEPQQSANFVFAGTLSTPYNVLYPASIYTDATHVTLPAVQGYKEGGFADGAFPMVGYTANAGGVTLSPLCALIKVSILRKSGAEADADDLVFLSFKGNANEQVSGAFTVNYQTAALTGSSSADADKLVKVSKTLATSTSAAVDYYLAVPARTYANGFTVKIQDRNGHFMEKSKTASVTFEAGHLYNLSTFDFVPTGTELGVDISSAAAFVQFATDFNAKKYDEAGSGLVVSLSADIAFDETSSKAFNDAGGIGLKVGLNGTEDYYFNGLFNGNGHKITGLASTAPLFAATGSNGTIKDLTIAADCSFTFTHPNTTEALFGSVVGYHKGVMENVTVNADVALAPVENVEYMTTLGGIVGRATTGTLSECVYTGLISTPAGFTAPAPYDDTNKRKLIIGGLVGRFSNAGSVTDSFFKGAICNEALTGAVLDTDDANNRPLKNNPYTIIGGIVGHVDGEATVSNCETTNDHELVATAYNNTNSMGHIVQRSTLAYHNAIGGIVGELNNGRVSNCTNGAEIFNTIFKQASDDSRYLKVGGIVGKNNENGIVSGCTNNGRVQHRSNPRIQDLGGIVGYNAGKVSACTNNAAVNHMTTGVSGATKKGGRVVSLGGVIGQNAASADVTNVHNTANIQISAMESGTSSDARMGGVIAYNLAEIDGGASKNITNSGQVYFSPNFENQFLGFEFGGIVGYSKASILNVKNTGYVLVNWNSDANVLSKAYLGGVVGFIDAEATLEGCVNEGGESNAGEVYVNVKAGAAKHTDNYAGGILGKATAKVTILECTNSGYVHGGNSTKQNGTCFYAGGIAGFINAAGSSISDCENTGVVYNNHASNSNGTNNTAFNGGIVGWIAGTAEEGVVISSCSHATGALSPRRGYSGGIAGYASYATISKCSVAESTTFSGSAYFIGGIAGWAVNSTLSGCVVNATTVVSTQLQRCGGVVAKLGAESVLDGCSTKFNSITGPSGSNYNPDTSYQFAAVAGESVAGSTIKNCHYPEEGTIKLNDEDQAWAICGDDLFTDGGGNAADL